MTKPRGVEWLEEQTGQTLEKGHLASEGRHLSLRVSRDLSVRLERYAADRGESVSQAARRLIGDGLEAADNPDRRAIDAAISVLENMRGDLGSRSA